VAFGGEEVMYCLEGRGEGVMGLGYWNWSLGPGDGSNIMYS
jgi:hypothetical protein